VFISYINELVDRLPDIDWFLEKSGKDHQLVTSTLSVAEVAFAEMEKRGGALSATVEDRIDSLWLSDDSPVRLAEPHLDIMFNARSLARQAVASGWSMREPMPCTWRRPRGSRSARSTPTAGIGRGIRLFSGYRFTFPSPRSRCFRFRQIALYLTQPRPPWTSGPRCGRRGEMFRRPWSGRAGRGFPHDGQAPRPPLPAPESKLGHYRLAEGIDITHK
jgi:hypothetical protein